MTTTFNAWASEIVAVKLGEAIAVDGKSIRASLSEYDTRDEDFVSVVSAYCTQTFGSASRKGGLGKVERHLLL
ncbi:MAG: hypothetical protein DCF22_23990, partial [Leptolyngbya sp.]